MTRPGRHGAGGGGWIWGALATLLTGCGPGADVVVGSKNFSEQDLLGEIVAQWIERTTDLEVGRRLHLGGTFIADQALENGGIDVYVEYTGTAHAAILDLPPSTDAARVRAQVDSAYRERGLEWFPPLGFENTFAMLVRRATADSSGVATLSEAATISEGWRAGFGPEFVERHDGLPGLVERYGLRFASDPRVMDLGLIYQALADEQIDFTAGNSTDGRIASLDLVMLADDRSFFPPYEAAPVARGETLRRFPALRTALETLGGRIDTEEMRRLNREVDVERRRPDAVARDWVEREMLDDPSLVASASRGFLAGTFPNPGLAFTVWTGGAARGLRTLHRPTVELQHD